VKESKRKTWPKAMSYEQKKLTSKVYNLY